jgi:dinuclear metal center YbgI/SA1388 family protein
MKLQKLMEYLEKVFEYSSFEEPYSSNGLQVEGKDSVNKIGFSVDATTRTIEEAIRRKCDVLISHHGIFWPSMKSISSINKKRIKLLLDNDLSLIGMHLPLDKHPKIGNNMELIKLLGGKVIGEFGSVSYLAKFDKEKTIVEVEEILNSKLDTKSKVFDFSNNKVKTFGICAGGGSNELYSQLGKKCDLFITGELKYDIIDNAREHKVSLIAAGHYATETVGIKALMKKMSKELKINVEYIEDKIDF